MKNRIPSFLLPSLVACFALNGSILSTLVQGEDRPNVIVLLADDLGFGDLSCYGHPIFRTPHIDRIAQEGARLTQFNTPTPFCAPTRASLLTGRYPFRSGMVSNPAPDGGPAADAIALAPSELTLAKILKDSGYATGIVGKWHLGHKPGFLPTDRGFDRYFGIPYSNDMRPVTLFRNREAVEYPVVQATLTRRSTDQALEFIRSNQHGPFFLYLAHAMPHKPLAASEAYYKKSGHGLYADVLRELDDSVGEVMALLQELKIDEKTLVLFTSDNGPWYGGSTGGLRGMKGSNWEGGYRVPMIARWPNKIPAGHHSAQLAIMMDLFPTILKATGCQMPDQRIVDGKDIMPLFTSDALSPHAAILGHQGPKLATIRDQRWKLHVLPAKSIQLKAGDDGRWIDPRAPDGVTILAPFEQYNLEAHPGVTSGVEPRAMQLFDLQSDPSEQSDVASNFPEEVKRLKGLFDRFNESVPIVEEVRRVPIR